MKFKLNFATITSILFLGVLVNSCAVTNKEFEIKSPDKLVQLSLNIDKGDLKYKLVWKDELMVNTSELSIFSNKTVTFLNSELRSNDSSWEPTWGQFSEIRDHYNELVLNLDMDGIEVKLISRVYNEGIGLRFEIDSISSQRNISFYSEYNLENNAQLFCPAGESKPIGPIAINQLITETEKPTKLSLPLVVEKTTNKHLAILDTDLYLAKGFNSMKLAFDKKKNVVVSNNKFNNQGDKVITPWRLILLGETAGDLVTNTVPVNLATPCKIENTDWIKPGKTLWDWRVHGYKAPDGFTYGINTESYKRFIDFAALKGIEYFLIDDSWYTHASEGHFELSDKLDLKEVISYAELKGVDLILYYDRKHGEYGDDALFPYYQSLGMKGIKYGFMGNNPDFSREAIQKSAESKLLIDFHDSPVPFTGMQRTYPNAISREYCHAQQDSRRAFTPEAFIKMALINAIQGPLDMNNGNFDITGINNGLRQKGPRKLNSYFTTAVSEVARTLIIFSGLVCIPDAPEAYLAKEGLFEFIQKMPVGKWDESHILHSKMGEHITTARRHGEEWFIGSVIDQNGGSLDIKLDFLKENQTYNVTFYEDTKETHCKTNPEAYQIIKSQVKKGDIIKANLAPGGGHAMWIRPTVN